MAFGFPAFHAQLIPLNHLSKSQFIQIAIYISKKINWAILSFDEEELTAVSTNNKNTWNETISISFEDENTVLLKSVSSGNQIYDRGRNKKHTEAFSNLLHDALQDLSPLNLKENIAIDELKKEERILSLENKTGSDTTTEISSFYSFFSIFIPVKDYFVTPILINLNIIIFLILFFSGVSFFNPKIQDLIDWGANSGPLTTNGEWWRLLSACFLHSGFFHLLINCIALAYVGLFLESYIKKSEFLILYILCGITANLGSLYWNKDIVSAGASGAIFGMYGILLMVIVFKVLKKKIKLTQAATILILIALNIAYGFREGVDSAAPIVGFAVGILSGFILSIFKQKRTIALILISTSASVAVVCLFINYKNSQVYIYQTMEYEKRMQEFVDMEKMALESYNTQYGNNVLETKENILYMLKDRGIYYWNENVTLISELDKLYLPQAVHKRNRDMLKYCKLRISVYELTYKKINENTIEYDTEIIEANDEIRSLLIKLNQSYTDS
ncbi:rhomboid family intramembrane serine protease [Flavobacterium sp. MC2016-06]|jgi:rhomboid protease GluP|uniref:rhomboid family intramembrane serine protease n=1 Tax=Flavobacterium sp. MC2016-06 TaxID=2676308 RepID=UPI0012BAB83A|nr:rhomboid family intramembrane serine protease [Flavobacterium sp. MC2016-06]MBU3860757.1 rhomboid family intramembrane serine protease [Flavobacterium sp. MC2016-06]